VPRWRTYLRLGRVSNLPTVWTDVLAGAALAGTIPEPATAVLLVMAVSLSYIGGMFLNDAFDRKVDARERAERPIPTGDIGVGEVFVLGFGMLGAGWLLVGAAAYGAAGGSSALWAGAALAAAIVLYDIWHKGNPLGPVLMGICRALVYMTAALVVDSALGWTVIIGALVLLAYVVGLTYVAKQEVRGRIHSFWPVALLATPLVYAAPAAIRGIAGAVLFGGLLTWLLLSLALLRRPVPDVSGAVARLIAGIALVDALLIAHSGFPETAWLAALGLPLTLLLQRYVRGT
jgi:4-hydroxybenzoate polyprenyltransferase